MIFIALFRIVIGPKAFIAFIIIMINCITTPAMTFDSKVIIAFYCEFASTSTTFKNTLRQCYARRNIISEHFFNG